MREFPLNEGILLKHLEQCWIDSKLVNVNNDFDKSHMIEDLINLVS